MVKEAYAVCLLSSFSSPFNGKDSRPMQVIESKMKKKRKYHLAFVFFLNKVIKLSRRNNIVHTTSENMIEMKNASILSHPLCSYKAVIIVLMLAVGVFSTFYIIVKILVSCKIVRLIVYNLFF